MKNKKILITGIAGFIGSNVAKKFIKEGFQVVGIDNLSTGKIENIPDQANFINGDLVNLKTFQQIKDDFSYILHFAGQSSGEISFEDPVEDLRKNTISTLNLIKYGIEINAKKILYASSMSIYGDSKHKAAKEDQNPQPISCYGISKLASEKYLETFSKFLPYVSMRMFNVYGPGQDLTNLKQGMVSIFIAQAIKSKRILVKGSLQRFRDFIYINDTVEAWYKATISDNVKNIAINIGTGQKTTVEELLMIIKNKIDDISYYSNGSTPGDQSGVFADNSKLKKLLKFKNFTNLEDGLQEYFDFLSK